MAVVAFVVWFSVNGGPASLSKAGMNYKTKTIALDVVPPPVTNMNKLFVSGELLAETKAVFQAKY